MQVATIGHNNPPSEIEILKQRLDDYKNQSETFDRLSQREVPEEISEDEEAGKLTDYIKSLKILRGEIDDIHKKEKKPFWDAGKAADEWRNNYFKDIDALVTKASAPVLKWNKKKEEEERQRQLEIARKAREEAEKLAAEAEAHAKEGIDDTANDLICAAIEEEAKADMISDNAYHGVTGRTKGGYSSAANRKPWTGVLDSRAALDLDALRNYFTEAELNKAIKAAVRDGKREIRGARIFQEDNSP